MALLRLLYLFITALWLFAPTMALGYDLLIVQTQRTPVYDELLRGLRSVANFSERMIVLADYSEVDLQRIDCEEKPTAIITLGDKAFASARKVRKTPVIALMTLNLRQDRGGNPSMTGVTLQISPDKYMPVFTALRAKRVGVISNSARSADYISEARRVAAMNGIDLVVQEVNTTSEVPAKLESLAGRVDLLWMLPDTVTSGGEAATAHFLFSSGHNIPLVTYSTLHLASGAAFAIDFDRFDMGKQAGEMALSLLNGSSITNIPPESPRKTTIVSNPAVLPRFGITPDSIGSRNRE
jgi:putative ABC transport system substrate-binding protein